MHEEAYPPNTNERSGTERIQHTRRALYVTVLCWVDYFVLSLNSEACASMLHSGEYLGRRAAATRRYQEHPSLLRLRSTNSEFLVPSTCSPKPTPSLFPWQQIRRSCHAGISTNTHRIQATRTAPEKALTGLPARTCPGFTSQHAVRGGMPPSTRYT